MTPDTQEVVIQIDKLLESSSFRKELEILINRFSKENGSDTPDWILSEYLVKCLEAFDLATVRRDIWFGFKSFGKSKGCRV